MQNVKLSYWNFYVTLIGVSLWCVCLYSNAATDNTSEYIYSILSVSVPNLLILLCFFFSFHFKPNSFDANTTQCYLTFASFHDVKTVNLVRLCKLKRASQYWILRSECKWTKCFLFHRSCRPGHPLRLSCHQHSWCGSKRSGRVGSVC